MDSSLRAERALPSVVLTGPDGQQHVLRCVQPDDFHRAWHGQVLAAMQRLRGVAVLAGPEQVDAELRSDPDLPRSVSRGAVPLADLLALHAGPVMGRSGGARAEAGAREAVR